MDRNDHLAHYGIKGMKWGIRKNRQSGGSSKRKSRQDGWSDEAREVQRLKKKKPQELSNAELKRMNERIQLEQNYARLNPSTIKKGLAIAGTTAAAMGTVLSLYNNSNQIVSIGRKVSDRVIDVAGGWVVDQIKW